MKKTTKKKQATIVDSVGIPDYPNREDTSKEEEVIIQKKNITTWQGKLVNSILQCILWNYGQYFMDISLHLFN